MLKHAQATHFQIYACLPFVELAQESSIQFGSVIFWPASKYKDYIEADYQEAFQAYLQTIGQIKAKIKQEQPTWINTMKLSPEGTTCLSIANNIPHDQRENVLIDSLYLLYFACIFKDLYYSNEIPSFNAFRKIIPASLEFIQSRQNWEHLHIDENYREETVCIHLFDPEICKGLGKTLSAIYEDPPTHSESTIHAYKRLIRSVRYLVDRFFQRFVNLFEKGLHFSDELFEPEDVIFLASSFEALFDINDKQTVADFKHKLRPLLHLKHSNPLEIFWKWVDDFYNVRRKIVHGGPTPDPLFRLNPNFEISHILIGIKLLIYALYYTLYSYKLLPSTHTDPYTPPDFKWIHPEEILLFFWTEAKLLQKLNIYTKQALQEFKEELYADIHLLTCLFVSMYERYFLHPVCNGIRFIPTPLSEIQHQGQHILEMLKKEQEEHPRSKLLRALSPHFLACLHQRMQAS
ncbi:hypothetical protein [Candidatus Protochlamydia phocaeensis]|uniref:hypothetical protein n=1 Tax=Candidatus Protochlamydia phocaeensis TaxID=1414722 RepID=UPI0008393BEC|nr:hypothetical protein [Candidatus Protochlamydia phocaeensis]